MTDVKRFAASSDWRTFALLQLAIDSIDDPIFVKDRQHRWIVLNEAFCTLLGHPREELLGKSDPDLFPPDQVEVFWRLDDILFESGEANENEESLTVDGRVHTLWTRKKPVRNEDGEVIGLCGIISDITDLRERIDTVSRLEAKNREKERLINAQQELIDAMAVPVIQLWHDVLLLPLVGALSTQRTDQMLEVLLRAISERHASLVFIDISGVPNMDAEIAQMLARAAQSVHLLGARAEVVGIAPEVARVLTETDIDLSHVRTRARLQDGLEAYMRTRSAGPRRPK